jgi:hypothetical protein
MNLFDSVLLEIWNSGSIAHQDVDRYFELRLKHLMRILFPKVVE